MSNNYRRRMIAVDVVTPFRCSEVVLPPKAKKSWMKRFFDVQNSVLSVPPVMEPELKTLTEIHIATMLTNANIQ